jgi:AraC family transcriptional regulator
MAEETRILGFGVTYDMAAARTACGQLLSLTSHRANDEFPPHRHANDYVCMVLKGGFSEVQSNRCRERIAGSFFVYEAGETHFDRIGSRGAMCLNLHFAAGETPPATMEGLFSAASRVVAARLAFELAASSPDELVMASLMAEILADIRPGRVEPRDVGKWISRIIEAIADEAGRRWTLNDLAKLAERHPVHLAQAFRAHTGISIGAFQRIRRLTSLSLALRNGGVSLAMLADEYGYCDQSHMNAEFRAAFGISPGRYRREFH